MTESAPDSGQESAPEMTCPRCGAEVDAAVASGMCPTCLLKQAALGTAADSIPATPWTPPSVEEIASEFDQLEIMELIGHGGMGAVYKARQKSLSRLVALKILAPQHADNSDFADRFSREGTILAEVNHPNIVTVHDFGRAGDFYFLLMEFVDGVNLRQAMTAGRLTPKQALAIVPPICEALQFAHDRGIVHRDIKPENLLLDKAGRIKIADFGIARMLRTDAVAIPLTEVGDAVVAGASEAGTTNPKELTRDAVLGTPKYMAPEQREQPTEVDHRADIYSLGVVLYEMLTGELPDATFLPPSRRVEIDVRLDEIVMRALEQNLKLRYGNATEFRNEVETVVRTPVEHPSRFEPASHHTPVSSKCYVTTPERIATIAGQIFLWRSHGLLVLNDRQLTITQKAKVYSIPLNSIRDLSTGRYPALVNPAGLDFISVTYETDGECRQLIFSPHEGLIGLPSHFNDFVAEWFDVIFAAVESATGRPPTLTPPHKLRVKGVSRWGLALLLIPLLLPIGTVLWILSTNQLSIQPDQTAEPSWLPILAFAPVMVAILLSTIITLYFRSKSRTHARARRSRGETSSPDPEANSTHSKEATLVQIPGFRSPWAIRFLAVAHLGFLGFLRHLPGFERAAGMYGFFGFIGVATFFEFRARYRHHPRRRLYSFLTALLMGSSLLACVGAIILPVDQNPYAIVETYDATIDREHFLFRHNVDCPTGWNVWLTLECVQLRRMEPGDAKSREPSVVKRYQTKLSGSGRVRVPLEFQPTGEEARIQLLASMGPLSGTRSFPSPHQGYGLLHYTTESLMRVSATLVVLPDGQTPDSQLTDIDDKTVRFVTIDPPAKPKLAPFEGAYSLGKVELVALNLQGAEGKPCWKPNGDVSTDDTIPDSNAKSSAAGKIIKEIVVRVHSETNFVSNPIIRIRPESGVSVMGGAFMRETTKQQNVTVIQRLACLPEALVTDLEVGIADGDWNISLTFDRHQNQNHFSRSQTGGPDGSWEGVVRTTEPAGDSIPLAFSYSNRDDHETRLVYEKADGTIVPLKGNGTDGNHGLTNSLTTLPLEEFETIKRFHVQSRRYEWIEFRNVSLQPGHHTNVEVQSAY
ncbi:MAG: protein kinase [Planctomycetota bacterium]|nr:protein kinase [Planctomycetota bacterium]